MLDIVFCNVPYCNLDYVYSAPAILKGVVQQHGYTAKTKDFGSELYKLCNRDVDLFYKVQQYFITPFQEKDYLAHIEQFYNSALNFFAQNPSQYIGISVMTIQSQVAAYEIIKRIKAAGIESKIVVGGCGIDIPPHGYVSFHEKLNVIDQQSTFGTVLKRLGLIDYSITGDGEDAVLAVLGGYMPGEDVSRSDQFKFPIPDYSDYEFDYYLFDRGDIAWPITGSKGCVRDCDFCDVKKLFGKYRYRSGSDVAHEIISLNQSYGAKHFRFTDSLVNGGLKPFREFLEILADYNDKTPNKIRWRGNYICRPLSQIPSDMHDLMRRSGATELIIGAESGSDNVLLNMNKKTTVNALFEELEQFRQHGVTCMLLMMIGHWSETHEDFLQHLDMLIKLTPYVKSGTIKSIRVGIPTTLMYGTPSYNNAAGNNITRLTDFVYHCDNNPDNTISEKIYRQLTIIKLLDKLKILSPSFLLSDLRMSHDSIRNSQQINDFYAQFFETVPSQTVVPTV